MTESPSPSEPPDGSWRRLDRFDALAIAGILGWGLLWLAPGLGHPGIQNWDESLHMAATRGAYDTFLYPHLWVEPLHALLPHQWWGAGVWLHKPVGPFWFGAVVMKIIGINPLGLRLASLLAHLGAAVAVYLMALPVTGRARAVVAALGLAALPGAWVLVQGIFFGDVTDATLAGFVTLSMALLVHAVRTGSLGYAAAAGAATGVAFLCKSVLGLTPLGVAGLLWIFGLIGRGLPGLRLSQLGLFAAAAVAVAAPWNLYAWTQWPEVFKASYDFVFGRITGTADMGPWRRPVDAIFNDVNATQWWPLGPALPVVLAVWLAVRAIRLRELPVIVAALWVWATWLLLSATPAKTPYIVWPAVPALFVGVACALEDARKVPALAGALVGALAGPWLHPSVPFLARLRLQVPEVLGETRAKAGLLEGLVFTLVGLAAFGLVGYALRRRGSRMPLLGAAGVAALSAAVLVHLPYELRHRIPMYHQQMFLSYQAELGPALDRAIPKRSVLYQEMDFDLHNNFEVYNSLFWTGRMTYREPPDLGKARSRGYHPYLISARAEPFAPVRGIPAASSIRAYDLEAPAAPAPLPEGLEPVSARLDTGRLVGLAQVEVDGDFEKYVLYVSPEGMVPGPIQVTFVRKGGQEERKLLEPQASLHQPQELKDVAWFALPLLGPNARDLDAIVVGPDMTRIPCVGGVCK